MLLNDHFAGKKGHEMVSRRAYALEEEVSGKDLDVSRPLHMNLRRGMRIKMSMIFNNYQAEVTAACPRCKSKTVIEKGSSVYW